MHANILELAWQINGEETREQIDLLDPASSFLLTAILLEIRKARISNVGLLIFYQSQGRSEKYQ